MNRKNEIITLMAGTALGLGAGLYLNSKQGKKMRNKTIKKIQRVESRIEDKVNEAYERLKDQVSEVKDKVKASA